MKTIRTSVMAVLFCAGLINAAFPDGPLTLIDTVAVDPEGVAGAVDGCEFSKDGTFFAASDNHAVARIYLTADRSLVGKVTHRYHDHRCADKNYELNAVVWSYDGQYLATGRNDDGVKVWKTDSFFGPADFATNDTPYKHLDDRDGNTNYECDGADFSPNNQWLATAADKYLMVYRLPDFKEIQDISAGAGSVNSVDFSYDSEFVAFGASNGNVKIVRTSDWSVIKTISSTNSVKSVRFSPNAEYLVYSGRDQRCRVYRTSDWSLVVDINHSGNEKALPCDDDDSNAAVEASAWSSAGAYLLTSGLISGELHVWDTSLWPASGSITLGSENALAIYQAQEAKRQIEFIDVFENKVIVGGDEGNVRMYEFPPLPGDLGVDTNMLTLNEMSPSAEFNIFNLNELTLNWSVESDTDIVTVNPETGIGETYVTVTGSDFTQDATVNVTVRNEDDPTDAETVEVQVQYTPDPGDVNINGTVGAVDVQLVINDALGLGVPWNCDINCDGPVDAVDVQLVINAALGLGISDALSDCETA